MSVREAIRPARAGVAAVAGLAAYLGGYLAVYVLHGSNVRNALVSDVLAFLSGDAVTWKLVGWLFYNAHYVDVIVPGLVGQSAVNLLSGAEDAALTGLVALPPLALALAGFAVGRATARSAADGAASGGAVVLGYLPAAVAGAVLVRVSVRNAASGPDFVTAALLAGAAYPIVFGAVGGALGGRLAPAGG